MAITKVALAVRHGSAITRFSASPFAELFPANPLTEWYFDSWLKTTGRSIYLGEVTQKWNMIKSEKKSSLNFRC